MKSVLVHLIPLVADEGEDCTQASGFEDGASLSGADQLEDLRRREAETRGSRQTGNGLTLTHCSARSLLVREDPSETRRLQMDLTVPSTATMRRVHSADTSR